MHHKRTNIITKILPHLKVLLIPPTLILQPSQLLRARETQVVALRPGEVELLGLVEERVGFEDGQDAFLAGEKVVAAEEVGGEFGDGDVGLGSFAGEDGGACG